MDECFPQYCPFCYRWSYFLPHGVAEQVLVDRHVVGGGYRLRARCACCSSTDRDRLLYLYLWTTTRFELRGARVLHIAPEPHLRKVLSHLDGIHYVTGDIRLDCKVQFDISRLPLAECTFDMIICNHVLEHVEDDGAAMRELCRVLKPGGLALLQVPIALALERTDEAPAMREPEERLRRFGQRDHVRLYGRDYPDRLHNVGLLVECIPSSTLASDRSIRELGLLADETLFVARRPPCPEQGRLLQ